MAVPATVRVGKSMARVAVCGIGERFERGRYPLFPVSRFRMSRMLVLFV